MFNPVAKGEVCSDTDDDNNNADTNDDDAQRTKHDCTRLFAIMSKKVLWWKTFTDTCNYVQFAQPG